MGTDQFADLQRRLATVIAFPVTPFQGSEIDVDALQALVDRMLRLGISAVACAGGTGEFQSLTLDECEAVYRATVEVAERRALVIAGVGVSAALASQQARAAERAGCDVIMALPPYLRLTNQDGLLDYYRTIAKATHLPLVVYARDGVRLDEETLVRLCAEVDTTVALKDGTGDLRAFQNDRRVLGDRLTWICGAGDDYAPAYFAAGAQGFTSSVANFDPQLALRLFDLCQSGDSAAAREFVDRSIRPLFRLRLRGYDVALTKAACRLAGLAVGDVRPPAIPLTADEIEELRVDLAAAGLIDDSAVVF